MKNIIFAIAFLAATLTVSSVSADNCTVKCTQVSGSWTGDTSVAIQVTKYVQILYDVHYKLFVVVNTEQNLIFATNGKFFLILNIETGGYILVDVKTLFAVYGKISIDFKNSDGTIDRTKLIIKVNSLLVKYESITITTSSSFNFSLLIVSFYTYQFDLTIIYKGQTQLIEALNASFSGWFRVIQAHIRSGAIHGGNCIWGFFVVILEIDVKIAIAIFNCIRISIEYYTTIQMLIIIEVVKIVTTNIQAIIVFSEKLTAIISTGAELSIKYIIKWATDVSNNPVTVSFSVGGSVYTFSIIRIDKQYVLRFTLKSNTGRVIDITILFVEGVLVVINQQTGISVCLYGQSFVIVNVTSEYALVGTWRLIGGVRGKIVKAVKLSSHIANQQYSKLAKDVKKLIKEHGKSGGFSFSALYTAVISGSVTEIGAVVGVKYAQIVLVYYRAFFTQCVNGGSFGAIVVGVFGNKDNVIVTAFFVVVINGSVAFGGSWFIIVQAILSGSPPKIKTSTSTSTSRYTYQYTIRGK